MKTWFRYAVEGTLGPAQAVPDSAVIIEEGQPASSAYFLSKGAAEIFHTSEEGFSVVVKLVTAPTILSSPELLVREPCYRASIRGAGPDTRVHHLSRPRFLQLLENHDANMEAMIDIGLAFTGAARFEPSRLYGTDSLLAMLLLAYADVFGTKEDGVLKIGLRRSQADLADAIGTAERSINRVLSVWKKEGLLTKEGGHYFIQDEARLNEIAGDLAGCMIHRWRDVLSGG